MAAAMAHALGGAVLGGLVAGTRGHKDSGRAQFAV